MHGQVLDSIDHARYLGVDISSDLNFSHHVKRITANASKSLGFLKRTKHPGIREAAYKATVRPQVEYASSVCSPYTKKTSIRKRDGSEKDHSLDSQLVLTLPKCYGTPTTIEPEVAGTEEGGCLGHNVIQNIHGLVAIPIPSYFEQPMGSARHTRYPLALRQIHTTANYYKFPFFPSTVVYWNQLQAQIILLPTLDQFSVAVRAHNHHIP